MDWTSRYCRLTKYLYTPRSFIDFMYHVFPFINSPLLFIILDFYPKTIHYKDGELNTILLNSFNFEN